jgi:hypothetical protein
MTEKFRMLLNKSIIEWDVVSWSKILKYWDKNINWGNIHTCLELGGTERGTFPVACLKGETDYLF